MGQTPRTRSRKAAFYGTLTEKKAREYYGLDADHQATHDARDDEGRPWDVKSAMLNRDDPRFRLWKDQHEYLARNDGGYVFVAYRTVGRGLRVERIRSVAATSIRAEFYGAGGHRGTEQLKIPPSIVY